MENRDRDLGGVIDMRSESFSIDRDTLLQEILLPIEHREAKEGEENPFATELGAEEWAASVEGERGMWRDNVLYPALRDWVVRIPVSHPILLDIGSGQGRTSSEVDGYGVYVGIEPSRFLVERAKALYSRDDRRFLEGSAYRLPIITGSVDGALMVNVLFHLEDMDRGIAEFARVLKAGGKFFLNTVNFDAIDLWKSLYVNAVVDEKMMRGTIPTPERSQSSNTLYFQPNEEIERLLCAYGLRIDSTKKTGGNSGKPYFVTYEGVKE